MMDKYRSESQQRILRLIFVLAGHETTGLALSEITRGLQVTSKSKVFRDLANLKIAGLAEQLPDSERWRLTPKLSQVGLAMLRNVEAQKTKLDEIHNRYTRDPR